MGARRRTSTSSNKLVPRTKKKRRGPVTLAIDIGGTGIKALLLDPKGNALTNRVRVLTPKPATPKRVIRAILGLVRGLGDFDRVSVGFPGVVIDDTTRTAPNLGGRWKNFPLARMLTLKLGRPVRVLNDAGIQGYGVIEGKGTEMVITLGTGMGAALYYNGVYIPNLELAHHPFRGQRTYEDYIGAPVLAKIGKKKWSRRVGQVIDQIDPIWNPRRIYIGGGNAKHLDLKLPKHVSITENVAGLLGGITLWRDGAPTR